MSVIIPTYNRADSLVRALTSVINQTNPADEIIVIDDGSSDDTRSVVEANFPMVRYFYQDNAGVSSARNRGADLASSAWLAFLDSDDEWMPSKLERQRQCLYNEPHHRIIHSDETWIRGGERVNKPQRYQSYGGWIFDRCLGQCALSPSTVVLEKNLFVECKGFREDFPVCEDYDLWLKICLNYPVLLCDEPLSIKYAGHDGQLSMKFWGMDRYRVISMLDLMESQRDSLSETSFDCLFKELKLKTSVLKVGAKKRGNTELMQFISEVERKLTSAI